MPPAKVPLYIDRSAPESAMIVPPELSTKDGGKLTVLRPRALPPWQRTVAPLLTVMVAPRPSRGTTDVPPGPTKTTSPLTIALPSLEFVKKTTVGPFLMTVPLVPRIWFDQI